MRDQVARHLERARLARAPAVVGTVTEVLPVVSALARTMEKIHDRARHRHRRRRADAGALPRRAAGPRGDGRQPRRQCLQVGAVAGQHRGGARDWRRRSRCCASSSTTTGRAYRRRSASRWRGAAAGSTRPSPAPASACRSWSNSPALYGGSLTLGDRADRRPARRTGAAGGVTTVRFPCRDRVLPHSSRLSGRLTGRHGRGFAASAARGTSHVRLPSGP